MTLVTIPSPEMPLSLADLAAIQRLASRHVTFSLTLACPLRCEHCIVSSSPDLHHTTMPVEVAQRYADQLADLASQGITNISFTGGEPTLARRPLKILAAAARAAGIRCSVVTAAPWARTMRSARRCVEDLCDVEIWDVSVDRYHERFVPLETVGRACRVLTAAGRKVTIRFTYEEPLDEESQRILDFIATIPDVGFACQRVRAVGRGLTIARRRPDQYNPWVKPCVTQGLVVRYDGSISPCCLNLVERRDHAFQYGKATDRTLVDIHADFMADPLLQLLRGVGFAEAVLILEQSGLRDLLPDRLPDEACEICELLMTDPSITDLLRHRLSDPRNQFRVAVIAAKSLGEFHMLESVLRRFEHIAADIPGYDDAARFAASHGGSDGLRMVR